MLFSNFSPILPNEIPSCFSKPICPSKIGPGPVIPARQAAPNRHRAGPHSQMRHPSNAKARLPAPDAWRASYACNVHRLPRFFRVEIHQLAQASAVENAP